MAAAGVSTAVAAVSPGRSSPFAVPSGGEIQASSSIPPVSQFFGQRCGVSSSSGESKRSKSFASSGAWAYATDSDYIRENFTSGSGHSGEVFTKDLYECLGVSRLATPEQIKTAYRTKARKIHPDVVPEDEKEVATKAFLEIKIAYALLSDPRERAAYDMKLRYRDRGPPALSSPSQWGFISVSNPDDPSGTVTFKGRNWESDFFS